MSDHTIGNTAAIASVALGASAIEKHFTLSREEKGPDSEFSIQPEELSDLKLITSKTWSGLGKEGLIRPEKEKSSKVFRRSLYFVKNLKKGSLIKADDIRRIRPGYGIKPKFENEIFGKKLIKDVEIGDPVKWDSFR